MRVCLAASLLYTSLIVLAPVPARSASDVIVESVHGRLAVVVREADLERVLAEISRATGVTIAIPVDTPVRGERVTTPIAHGSLEEVLRRLLRHRNLVFVYAGDRLEAVHVYGAGRAPVAPTGPADAADRMTVSSVERDDAPLARAALRATVLGDGDPSERMLALVQLATSQHDAVALDTVVQVLERDDDAEVLDTALTVLRTHDAMPVEGLLAFVRGHAPGSLRSQAIALLERGFNAAAVRDVLAVHDVLRSASLQDADEEVRRTAARVLESIGND